MTALHNLLFYLFSLSLLLPFNVADSIAPTGSGSTGQTLGPWGSTDTSDTFEWVFTLGENEKMKSFIVRHADIVDAIGLTIIDGDGRITIKEYGNIDASVDVITFDEDEHIVRISGKHGTYRGNSRRRTISQLTITTNKRLQGYGPYGKGSSSLSGIGNVEDFDSDLISADILGFYGTVGSDKLFLESLGVTLAAS